MKIVVLGAGRMGYGAVFDLARNSAVDEIGVADIDADRVREVAAIDSARIRPYSLDVNDQHAVVKLLAAHDAAISCVVYEHNVHLAEAAIEAGTHFCDLGGNNDVVGRELALDGQAREAGINIIPDCGLAPGMVSLLAVHGASRLDKADSIHIRVGGLPQRPRPPLDYQMVFSVEGLINEYVEPARLIRDGKITHVESMTELESLEFPPPYGQLEAFQTSGGTSTLPLTFLGKIRELDYKTIRYPGHCDRFKVMIDLGLASSQPIEVRGTNVIPRHVFGRLLVEHLPHDEPDAVLVRLDFKGRKEGREVTLRYQIVDEYDQQNGISAMMRTTAFPASIVAQMMARGETSRRGALPQEACLPPDRFMEELARRNIVVEQSFV